MPFIPQAITAAVALSAAGRWQCVGGMPATRRPEWLTMSPLVGDGAATVSGPVAHITAPLRAQSTADRACNLACELAADLTAVAPHLGRLDSEQVGVCVTVSKGGIGPWMDVVAPLAGGGEPDWPAAMKVQGPEAAGAWLAEQAGWRGPRLTPVAACATGVADLACGARLRLTEGLAAVVCGGSESSLHPAVLSSMQAMGILDGEAMRPFDRRNNGFNLGEGGGLLVLEPFRESTAPPAAWLTGAALLADGHHMTALHESRQTLTRVLRQVFRRRHPALGRAPRSVYINAHATGTTLNDRWETDQLIAAFGAGGWARTEGWVAADAEIWISGTKSLTGHLLGASAAVEAVICVAVLQGAPPPPTLRLIEPRDPWPAAQRACAQLHLIGDGGGGAVAGPIAAAISLNYGFGGHVGALLFEGIRDGR